MVVNLGATWKKKKKRTGTELHREGKKKEGKGHRQKLVVMLSWILKTKRKEVRAKSNSSQRCAFLG